MNRSCIFGAKLCRTSLALIAVSLALCGLAGAHDHNGPPLRIINEQHVGPWMVSVWSHPHVGTGKFFVMVMPMAGGTLPEDLKVEIGIQPVSGRLPEKFYTAHPEPSGDHKEYVTEVAFDSPPETWRVRVRLQSRQGGGEALTQVETSEPGPARWQLLLFLLPFVAVGFLWLRAMTRRRSLRSAALEKATHPS